MTHRRKFFIDTNILIGAFSFKYEKYRKGAKDYKALQKVLKHYTCSTSVLSVAQTISSKERKRNEVQKFFLEDFKHLDFLTVEKSDILKAFNLKGTKKNGDSLDVEDNIQFVVARDNLCNAILTNNLKDYSNYPLMLILTTKAFLSEKESK